MKYIEMYPPGIAGRHRERMLSEEPTIRPNCRIYKSEVGAWTELMEGTSLVESTFGDYSYTAGDVQILYSDIGKFCSIASHVRINPPNHPMWRVTQSHMTYRRKQYGLGDSDDSEIFEWRKAHRVKIGHDVWIGHAAIVMPGVSVGIGAVIGSGAVVTKDVAPYEIVGGVPAKRIRMRFSAETIQALLASEWWNWDRATLEAQFDDLLDLDHFLNSHGQPKAAPIN